MEEKTTRPRLAENSPLRHRLRHALEKPTSGLSTWDRDERLQPAGLSDFTGLAEQFRITPARLVSIIAEADTGDPRPQAALFLAIQEKEPLFAAHLQTRRLAVLSCKWRVQSEQAPEAAAEAERMLRAAGFRDALRQLLDAIGTGYAGAVANWAPGGAAVLSFTPVSPDRWVFDDAGNPAIVDDRGRECALSGFHPAQVLYTAGDGKTGLPCRAGVLRTLLWLYLYKNASFRDWNRFLERFGIPFILGKLPSGDFNDVKKRNELLRSVMQVRGGGSGVGTTETDMQILNGTSGTSQQAFESFQRYCDEVATMVILGQLASSDHSGGLSNGGAQAAVRQDILQADCGMLERPVQNLVDWWGSMARGLPFGTLVFSFECELPEDMNQKAERDAKVAAAAGCRLTREYAEKTYGVQLEELPQQPADPMGGMGGMGGIPRPFSDSPDPMSYPDRRTAADIAMAGVRRLVDADAFAAWRGPIEAACREAFGGLEKIQDPQKLLDAFRERAPRFLEKLPGLLDAFDSDAIAEGIHDAMLAGFLNAYLPPDFWKARGTAK